MAIGITAVALVSLASRFFPDLFGDRDVTSFLPSSLNRLSFPLDYWNGLAILLALGIPLLLRAAIVERSHVARGLAVTSLPAVVAALYLTSSRGGVAAAVLATVAFFAMTSARWAAGGAIGLAALGGAAAVGVLLDRHELVNGPFDSPLAASQGESAAVLLTVICLLTGIAYGIASRVVAEVSPPRPAVGRAVLLALAVVALAGIVRLDPVSRVEAFKEPPRVLRGAGGEDRIRAHLASASGNGRWQLWSAAVDEFKAEPVHGGGAGSYEAWWTEHGTLSVFVRDAHALYPEVLGELGIVGFVLLLGTFGSALAAVVLRLRRLNGSLLAPGGERTEERATLAAFAASFVVDDLGIGAGIGATDRTNRT